MTWTAGFALLATIALPSTPEAPGRKSATTANCVTVVQWQVPEQMLITSDTADASAFASIVTRSRLNAIARAVAAFCAASGGRLPSTVMELASPPRAIDLMLGRCRLDVIYLRDGWEQPIYLSLGENAVVIVSAGRDGLFGGADDVHAALATDPGITVVKVADVCAARPDRIR